MVRLLRMIMPGLLFSLVCMPPLFAREEPEVLKLLNDSALALRDSHAKLAAVISAIVLEEAAEAQGLRKAVLRSERENNIRRRAHVKLMKDSAEALKDLRPELAEGLLKAAAGKEALLAQTETKSR